MHAIKRWSVHPDKVLSLLCSRFLTRKLYKTTIQSEPFLAATIAAKQKESLATFELDPSEVDYVCFTGEATNTLYQTKDERINILFKDGSIKEKDTLSNKIIDYKVVDGIQFPKETFEGFMKNTFDQRRIKVFIRIVHPLQILF